MPGWNIEVPQRWQVVWYWEWWGMVRTQVEVEVEVEDMVGVFADGWSFSTFRLAGGGNGGCVCLARDGYCGRLSREVESGTLEGYGNYGLGVEGNMVADNHCRWRYISVRLAQLPRTWQRLD